MTHTAEPRIAIAGGGTGGHLCPAVAVAEELVRLAPDAQVEFLGSGKELERKILEPTRFRYHVTDCAPMNLGGAWRTAKGVFQARRVLRGLRPDLVLGLGGYVSGPGVFAARTLGLPIVLFEPNAVAGNANRLLARWAEAAYVHFPETELGCPTLALGTPIGQAVRRGLGCSRMAAIRALGLDPRLPTLLIMGGSQGAAPLNQWIFEHLPASAPRLNAIHLCGKGADAAALRARYADAGVRAYVQPFVRQIGTLYRAADLAVVRGGGGTLAELQAVGLPAFVVPLPASAGDHQRRNAEAFAASGAGEVLAQAELDADALERALECLASPTRLTRWRSAAQRAGHPQAARRVAEDLLQRISQRHTKLRAVA
ncbi:MAG: undecaprenyldiphospho-muramoylpentapeptide beta-N-acetylglucosaminyltransferase [Planctomycetes bacterium]|nr:undecaprenyldiphospho-muramoylpentapeptide beta-N-acetylglucosaminyltransferase [Planctomycetota bacterium]